MELWHGSPEIVWTPLRGLCRPYNDYGPGFYCTPYAELAREWACPQRGKDGIANRYELDLGGLGVLDLEAEGCSVLTRLAVLVSNRPVQVSSPIARDGMGVTVWNTFAVCSASTSSRTTLFAVTGRMTRISRLSGRF